MDAVEVFGSAAVLAMLICYALESRGRHFVLFFAAACAASSTYAALIAAWPFAAVEAVWALVAVRRWRLSPGRPRARPTGGRAASTGGGRAA